MLRAAIAAEAAGVPSVSLVCEGFERQARATGRGLGYDGMPLAVLAGHVDAQSAEELEANLRGPAFDQVVAGLTQPVVSPGTAAAEPAALDVVGSGDVDEINRLFRDRGWSDGSPIVPPTRARIEAFLAAGGYDPWRTLGAARPSGRDVTIWSIAVNAVMAGCDPAHLPVLIAIAEVLLDPAYGAEHSGNTTGADAQIVLSGPSVAGLGFNSGQGALRDGVPANTTVGRWLRLYQRNVFGFTAEEHDKATFGNSFRVVLAEDQPALDELGWPALATDFGFAPSDDVAVLGRINSGVLIGSVFGSTPDAILPYLGDGLARVTGWDLTHVHGIGRYQYRPLLILSPVLARVFARAGWSKDDLRRGLYEHARIPAWRFESLIGLWSNLTAGRPRLVDLVRDGHLPEAFARSEDPDRLVPIVDAPSRFLVAVAGDPHRTNAYAMANDGPHGFWTGRRIDLAPSADLACRVDGVGCVTTPTPG